MSKTRTRKTRKTLKTAPSTQKPRDVGVALALQAPELCYTQYANRGRDRESNEQEARWYAVAERHVTGDALETVSDAHWEGVGDAARQAFLVGFAAGARLSGGAR
jgi:hypothetical protein